LVAPLLLFILLVIADFGRVFYKGITLSNAARVGAQYGAQDPSKAGDSAGIQQAATQEAQNIGAITVTSSRTCNCQTGGAVSCTTQWCDDDNYGPPRVYVQVTTSSTFNTLLAYPGIPNSISLSRTVILRVQ
jgi:Flp pilus assembly protein TadG